MQKLLQKTVMLLSLGMVCCVPVARADSRVHVNQLSDNTNVTFVVQASEITYRRVVSREFRSTEQQPPVAVSAPQSSEAQILELSASGRPLLPDAHISIE